MQFKWFLPATIFGFLVFLPLAAGQDSDLQSARQWIVNQPHDFSNLVLFERRGQTIVRSSRYESRGAPFGDFDGDFDIDQHDYYAMQICLSFSGPGFTVPPACLAFDRDGDDDVDLLDVAEFQSVFTGTVIGVFVEAGELVPVIASPNGYYSGAPGTWGNNALNGIARQAGYSQDDLWYQWTMIAKPDDSGDVIIANSALPSTAYTITPPLLVGQYAFQLKVTNLVTLEFGLDTAVLNAVECFAHDDCNDIDACNMGMCLEGTCLIFVPDCDDDLECTTDFCFPEHGCYHFDNCPGGQLCNTILSVCEGDQDSDGVPDDTDNCPGESNPTQADDDSDGDGNVCDNCPTDANSDQANSDGDACGNVCDADCDGGGTPGVQVNAGADRTVCPGSNVTLAATFTPATATIAWSQLSGAAVSLTPSGNTASFTAPSTSAVTLDFRATGNAIGFTQGTDQVRITTRLLRLKSSGAAQPGDAPVSLDLADEEDQSRDIDWAQDAADLVQVTLTQPGGGNEATFTAPAVTTTTDLHFIATSPCAGGGNQTGNLTVQIQIGEGTIDLPATINEGATISLPPLTTVSSTAPTDHNLLFFATDENDQELPPGVVVSINSDGLFTVHDAPDGSIVKIAVQLWSTADLLDMTSDTMEIQSNGRPVRNAVVRPTLLSGEDIPFATAGNEPMFGYTAPGGLIPQIGTQTQGFANYPLFMNGTNGTSAGGVANITSIELVLTGLTHTQPDDLDIYLISPFGETVEVMTDKGDGFAIVGMNLIFNDLGLALPADGAQLVAGTYATEDGAGGMNKYIGNSGGTDAWQLVIIDDSETDQGNLVSFTLRGTFIAN